MTSHLPLATTALPELDAVERAMAALGPADASLLDLHLRHGLGPGALAPDVGSRLAAQVRLAWLRVRVAVGAASSHRTRPRRALARVADRPVVPAPPGQRAQVRANLLALGVPVHAPGSGLAP